MSSGRRCSRRRTRCRPGRAPERTTERPRRGARRRPSCRGGVEDATQDDGDGEPAAPASGDAHEDRPEGEHHGAGHDEVGVPRRLRRPAGGEGVEGPPVRHCRAHAARQVHEGPEGSGPQREASESSGVRADFRGEGQERAKHDDAKCAQDEQVATIRLELVEQREHDPGGDDSCQNVSDSGGCGARFLGEVHGTKNRRHGAVPERGRPPTPSGGLPHLTLRRTPSTRARVYAIMRPWRSSGSRRPPLRAR